MFDQVVKRACFLERYRNGPFASERSRYLTHLKQRGNSYHRLRVINKRLLEVAERVDLSAHRPISMADLVAASEVGFKQRNILPRSVQIAKTDFISIASNWLRFLGRLDEAQRSLPFADRLEEFLGHLREERGFTEATVIHRRRALGQFFLWLAGRGGSIATVNPKDLTEYFLTHTDCKWRRATIASYIHALRSFFRYATSHSWCRSGIAEAIDPPRLYSQEALPQGLAWKDVQRLIASVSGEHPTQIRNRAVTLLLAVYGFRIGEVCNLTLDDLDWEAERIHLRRLKQRKAQDYPLTAEVGTAILRYLKDVRARSNSRQLFLTVRMPYRPISMPGLGTTVENLIRKLGIELPHYGPHMLRHACATHLLSQGFSFKEIGDHLGHRSTQSTQIYAKVNLPLLWQVADQDLSELTAYAEKCHGEPEMNLSPERFSALREVARLNLGGVL